MSQPAIELKNVTKRYVKYDDAPMLVTRALRFRSRTKRSELLALRDIDVEIARGECVGVIGRNGSGKSTMLRLLAGVTGPTTGRVAVRGRVAPLISVGVGFHNELTGRENVYVNGSVLGMSRSQIDTLFDSIVDFAEVGPFIDTPVKFYSSGMFVRLGFSVAVAASPEILLVDEVLAVGDIAFQMKCLQRMGEIQQSGTTIVMVSHNLASIRNLCPRTIVLHYGEKRHDGDTNEGIGLFHELIGERRELDDDDVPAKGSLGGAQIDIAARFENLELRPPPGRPPSHLEAGDEVTINADVIFDKDVKDAVFGLAVVTGAGVVVYTDSTPWVGSGPFRAGTRARFTAQLPINLATGPYEIVLSIQSLQDNALLARQPPPLSFYVSGRKHVFGIIDLTADLTVDRVDAEETG